MYVYGVEPIEVLTYQDSTSRKCFFLGLAKQGASASNVASKGQISPILAGPRLVKYNMDPFSNAPRTHATISLAVETTVRHQGVACQGG